MNISKGTILYDSDCVLCNGFVKLILKKASQKKIDFKSLHSESVKKIFENFNDLGEIDSVCYYKNSHLFIKSNAIVQILKDLGGLWKVAGFLYSIMPVKLRDFLYDYIATKRLRWFGKAKSCYVTG